MDASMNIHHVIKVEIATEVVNSQAYGNYVVKTVTIRCGDNEKFELTLFGEFSESTDLSAPPIPVEDVAL